MSHRRFDPHQPFTVGGLEFTAIDDAVDAAVAASKLKANGLFAQITQSFQKGFASYPGSCIAFAHFRNGVDMDEFAADEDGVPDLEMRSQAFRVRAISLTAIDRSTCQ